jgi:serine/tyrosine/threonine adenylyltransferase
MATLETLRWDNAYRRLPAALWTDERVTPLSDPWLVAASEDAARALDLDPAELRRPELVQVVNGERALPGLEPIATAYGGHQFGVWVPRLGDGRAILLGEVATASGETWDVQVKGSGRTAFARVFDGRAVLRSSIRELLASEAMHALGVPTTRALCVVGGSTPVQREEVEPGALLVRLAPTHVRFGTFEGLAHAGRTDLVSALADAVIARDFPSIDPAAPERHLRLLEEAIARTARLVARWQAVGFTHGVLNTDNMSILGLTLDYGPFAFMETLDPGFTPNHSDPTGRYAFDRQPTIAVWNLAQLARALSSLVPLEQADAALEGYGPAFVAAYVELMREKLGLAEWRGEEDEELLQGLLVAMIEGQADLTRAFRGLSTWSAREAFRDPAPFDGWVTGYEARVRAEGGDPAARRARMDRANPRYVLRTWLAQRAIERAEAKDGSEVQRLLEVLRRPFDDQPGLDDYAREAPGDARPIVLSCSS